MMRFLLVCGAGAISGCSGGSDDGDDSSDLGPGQFTDERDGEVYGSVQAYGRTIMSENLRFDAGGNSWCYDDNPENCKVYGRLYDWDTAMADDESTVETPSLVQGLCPEGWYIPGWEEWDLLKDDIVAASEMGKAGENLLVAFGIDPADPTSGGSGMRDEGGTYQYLGTNAGFWAATHTSINSAWHASLSVGAGAWLSRLDSSRYHGRSIRCFKLP